MMEDNVVQLQEEMRVKAAFDSLKDEDEASQRQACDRFEKRFGLGAAKKLRDRLGLAEEGFFKKPEAQPRVVEPKTAVVEKPAERLAYKQRADGSWAYSINGGMWRLWSGPAPKRLASPPLKTEPELKEEPKKAVEDEPKKAVVVEAGRPVGRGSLKFQHSKNPVGIPPSLENAIIAIEAIGAECRYDVFHDRIIVKGHECGVRGDAHENLENVTLKIRQAVLDRYGFDPGSTYALDALRLRCLDHIFDPVRDYLDELRWDGVKRLDNWLVRYCRASNTPLNRAIGRKMLIAAVRRVREPGVKFDYIVVLEGAQGVGKSSLLRILAGEENFSDNEILGLHKKEQQEAIQGVWIYEVAELEGLQKWEVTKIKLFASKTFDGARPAYGRSRVDRPRRCIFVATTNEDTYLRDTTGNRRFWPVQVGVINLDAVRRDRDQLWAEAAMVEASGEPLVIGAELWGDVAAQQQAKMELDPWEDMLAPVLGRLMAGSGTLVGGGFVKATDANGDPEWRVATDYLLTDVLSLPKERQNNNHTKRLAGIMRGLGWLRSETTVRFGKVVKRGFTKPCG